MLKPITRSLFTSSSIKGRQLSLTPPFIHLIAFTTVQYSIMAPSKGTITTTLSQDYIMSLGLSFQRSRTLLTAVEVDLFTALHDGPLMKEEIGERLGLRTDYLPDFLDMLYSLNILTRNEGKLWDNLTDKLRSTRTDQPNDPYGILYKTEEDMDIFIKGMISQSSGAQRALAKKFDFGKYKTLLDIGGATGSLCCEVVKQHPHISATSYDIPDVNEKATKHIADFGLEDKVVLKNGDFNTDGFDRADVITMGFILHNQELNVKKMLIRKAYDALPEGGAYIVIEKLIDNDRQKRIDGLIMSLQMLLFLNQGFDFTENDADEWVKDAGFKSTYFMELEYPIYCMVATK